MSLNSKKLGAALLLLSTGACTSLQPVANPQAFLSKNQPTFIVVTTPERSEPEDALVFHGPKLEGGTLSGIVLNEPQSLPVTQVRTMLARQFDKKRTTMAFVVGTAVAGTTAWVMSQHNKNGKASAYDNPNCGHTDGCYIPPNTLPKATPLPR